MSDKTPKPFKLSELRREQAVHALYDVQGAIKIIFTGRFQDDSRRLEGDEFDAIIELREKAIATLVKLCPSFEDWALPKEEEEPDE